MSFVSFDIEADGPIPGDYSMISLGAIIVEPSLTKTFYAEVKPISDKWIPDALAISGFSREKTLTFEEPIVVMERLAIWLKENSIDRPIFISDNNGFDFAFINWYFHHFTGSNPLGWSSRRISDLYCGLKKDSRASWKHLRKTKHNHNALTDATANAEVILEMQKMGLKIKLV